MKCIFFAQKGRAADAVFSVFFADGIHGGICLFLFAPILLQKGKLYTILFTELARAHPQQPQRFTLPDLIKDFRRGGINRIGAVDGICQLLLVRIDLKIGGFQRNRNFFGTKLFLPQTHGNGFR